MAFGQCSGRKVVEMRTAWLSYSCPLCSSNVYTLNLPFTKTKPVLEATEALLAQSSPVRSSLANPPIASCPTPLISAIPSSFLCRCHLLGLLLADPHAGQVVVFGGGEAPLVSVVFGCDFCYGGFVFVAGERVGFGLGGGGGRGGGGRL
jgi:hypothetical protein